VHVRLTKGVTTLALQTNASGVATFYCDDGTWTLALSLAGYTYTASTHVVDGNESISVSMAAVAISAPSDPDQCACYLYTRDAKGDIQGSVTLTFALVDGPDTGTSAYPLNTFTATSNASTGLLQANLLRKARYSIRRGTKPWVFVWIPDDDTYALPDILGYDA